MSDQGLEQFNREVVGNQFPDERAVLWAAFGLDKTLPDDSFGSERGSLALRLLLEEYTVTDLNDSQPNLLEAPSNGQNSLTREWNERELNIRYPHIEPESLLGKLVIRLDKTDRLTQDELYEAQIGGAPEDEIKQAKMYCEMARAALEVFEGMHTTINSALEAHGQDVSNVYYSSAIDFAYDEASKRNGDQWAKIDGVDRARNELIDLTDVIYDYFSDEGDLHFRHFREKHSAA